jgi:hypothetical protein
LKSAWRENHSRARQDVRGGTSLKKQLTCKSWPGLGIDGDVGSLMAAIRDRKRVDSQIRLISSSFLCPPFAGSFLKERGTFMQNVPKDMNLPSAGGFSCHFCAEFPKSFLSSQPNLIFTSPRRPKSARMKSPEATGTAAVSDPERITSPLASEILYAASLLASQATA